MSSGNWRPITTGEDCQDDDNEEEEKKESMEEKLDLVRQLQDDMEDAIEVAKQRHKALKEFKVSNLKGFAIGGQKDDLWKKVGKKSKSNILKRKACDESKLVKNMKKGEKVVVHPNDSILFHCYYYTQYSFFFSVTLPVRNEC